MSIYHNGNVRLMQYKHNTTMPFAITVDSRIVAVAHSLRDAYKLYNECIARR